jgi:hypothetical protein
MPKTNSHSPPPRRNRPSRTALLAAAALAVGLLAGCGGGDDYCATVEEHQTELTDVTASGSPAALLDALPIFRDLQDHAPDDIEDDWAILVEPLGELEEALRAADVDPSSYDPDDLPAGLSDADRQRVEDAGAALAEPAVAGAFDAVQQQAKDVCHTPLSL